MNQEQAIHYADQITCPYCGYEDDDSWEMTEENELHECGNCEKYFDVERHLRITYSSRPKEEE